MRKFVPGLVVLGTVALVILALFALKRGGESSSPRGDSGGAGRVVIISPHNEGIQKEFKCAFETWHLARYGEPCEVEWRDHGGTTEDVRYIRSEFTASPQGIGVDIFWGGGIEPYIVLADLGLLQSAELSAETLATLPADIAGIPLYDPQQRWFGTALSGFGILYNRARVAGAKLPEPRTWEDIGAPEFFGELAVADPRASGTAAAMVEVVLQAYGWEKGFEVLTRTAGNVKNFSRAASDIPKLVSLGQVSVGTAVDFYAWMQIRLDGREKIGFVLPEGLTPLTPDGMAVLKGAPNAEAARRFVTFVLSEEGQALWVLPKGAAGGPVDYELLRIPVLPGIYAKHKAVTNVQFDPSQAKAGFVYDAAKASARRAALADLYNALFIRLQADLNAAWKGVIARGLKPDEVKRLCTPPMSEQELIELSTNQWSNPSVRNNTITDWVNAAQARYRELAR